MADNKDFEFQLRAEQEFKATQQLQQGNRSEGSGTYVDPRDGTVYEWDPQRKGWFPKVSEGETSKHRSKWRYGPGGGIDGSVAEHEKTKPRPPSP